MLKLKICLVVLVLFAAQPLARADQPKNAKELGTQLAHALTGQMMTAYACQTYLGGLAQYRMVKLQAIEVDTRASGDRNKAVLQIDKIEDQIKATQADKKMIAVFDKTKLSYADRVSACNNFMADGRDKIQHIEAELGLL